MSEDSDTLKILTKDEARAYLRDGTMPENWGERVKVALEFSVCPNCGGVKDMNQVMRDWFNEFESPCPFCTGQEPFEWEMYP